MNMLDTIFTKHRTVTTIVGFAVILIANAAIFQWEADSVDSVSKARAMELSHSVMEREAMGGPGAAAGEGDLTWETTGHGGENSDETITWDPSKVKLESGTISSLTVTLTWTDEPDTTGHTNQPDTFSLEAEDLNGMKEGAGPSDGGSLTLKMDYPDGLRVGDGPEWKFTVSVGDCGDQEAMFSIFGVRDQADSGNDYTLRVSVTLKE